MAGKIDTHTGVEGMMTEGNPGLARTTAGRVSLVFRTKVELYYFLAMEGKCPSPRPRPSAHRLGPRLLRPRAAPRPGAEGPRAVADDSHRERLPASGEDHRHVLPPAADEGREEGTSPSRLAGVAAEGGLHARSSSRKTMSRRPSCLTSRGSASRSSWRTSLRRSPC